MAKLNEWWKHPALEQFFNKQVPPAGNMQGGTEQMNPLPQQNQTAPTQNQNLSMGPKNTPSIPSRKPMPQQNNGRYGYTGKGPDGVTQPDRRVPGAGNGQYDAHESEFVFDANSTQAIGPDVLSGVKNAASSGQLDVNKLREAIGQQTKPGYQSGGVTATATANETTNPAPIVPTGGLIKNLLPQKKGRPEVTATATPVGPTPTIPTPGIFGKPFNQKKQQPPVMDPTIPKAVQPTMDPTIPKAVQPTIGPATDIPGAKTTLPTDQDVPITPGGEPPKKDPNMVDGSKFDQTIKGPDMVDSDQFPTTIDDTTTEAVVGNLSPDVQQEIKDKNIPLNEIMDYLRGIMDGSNPYFQQIKDLLMQDIGGAGAAATAALKAEARMRGMSEEQIASMGVTRARDVEAISSEALGQLSAEQSRMGMQAAKDLFGMEIDKADFEDRQQIKADQDLAAHLIANHTTEGYDWKKDPEALVKMGAAWSAAGFSEPFDINNPQHLAWAQRRFDVATQTPGQKISGQIRNTPTYKNAPKGGNDADGNPIYEITNPDGSKTYTQEFYDDKLIPFLSRMTDFGTQVSFTLDANNNIIAIDNASGKPIASGDFSDYQPTIGGGNYRNEDGSFDTGKAVTDFNNSYNGIDVTENGMGQWLKENNGRLPTADEWEEFNLNNRNYDFDSEEDVSAAVDVFEEEFMLDGITDNAMKQYLEQNNGNLPKNEKAWEKWSKSERVYEPLGEDLTAAYNSIMTAGGDDATRERMKQYLEENNGKLPTLDEWNSWNEKTGNYQDIKKYLSGDMTDLRDVDFKLLKNIREAQRKVNVYKSEMFKHERDPENYPKPEELDEETIKLAESLEGIGDYSDLPVNNDSEKKSGFWGTGMGKTHRKLTYNTNIYEPDSASNPNSPDVGQYVRFNSHYKSQISNMAGKVIFYDGKYYRVDAENPIEERHKFDATTVTSGNDKYTMNFYADAMKVKNLETGEIEYITFGAKGKYWD